MTPDILITLLSTLGTAMVGFVAWLIKGMHQRLDALETDGVTENRVRSIITDKAEALHLADLASSQRLDRVESRITRIDDKLDRVVEMLTGLLNKP